MPSKAQEYLQIMLTLAEQGGRIAMKHLNKSGPTLKKDLSVITRADKEISTLCHQKLKVILKDPTHLLIDEEDPNIEQYLDQKRIEQATYIWSLDPIDGTRLYANGMPMFGISLGLLKDRKPWLGVVFFPVLKELFYCDGKDAYYVQNAFSNKQKRRKIKPIHEILSPKSIFFCNDTFFNKFNWKDKDFHIMINACAVVNLCWPAIGRGMGCFMKSNLWDYAGSWPIMQKAGMEFRSIKTGKVMDHVHTDFYNSSPKPWELKEYYLVSSLKNFSKIKSKIITMSSLDLK